MNAYLYAAIGTCTQARPDAKTDNQTEIIQTWDDCMCAVAFGISPEDAQKQFEAWLNQQPPGENPIAVVVHKIAGAAFIDRLLTESGNMPLDWPRILPQMDSLLQAMPVDDFEQGYWVDVDEVVQPGKLSFSAGTLESDVPEDVRSGLNWAADRKFFFVVSVLTPPPRSKMPGDETGEEIDDGGEARDEAARLTDLCGTFPMACDKEAVALVQARNSVVAGWLWRTYAAKTPLAAHQIRIDPWPGTVVSPND
ncbi:MAG TPA: hypothetical protein VMH87_12635 [Pseudomonadales bacterium]|nr:hypothetical protein [Pseudomonadales bacterium]